MRQLRDLCNGTPTGGFELRSLLTSLSSPFLLFERLPLDGQLCCSSAKVRSLPFVKIRTHRKGATRPALARPLCDAICARTLSASFSRSLAPKSECR